MGFFSFKTSSGKSIPNIHSSRPTFTVYMVMPNNTKYREDAYDGYGVFGGVDFYETVAELNDQKGRAAGITLQFHPPEGVEVKFPRFTEDPDKKWEDLKDPEDCPSQGYFY
jgi:hypothetical protein